MRRVEGMGLGDVKMLAMIGAVIGWRAVPGVLLLGRRQRRDHRHAGRAAQRRGMQLPLPFGVFLGIAFLAVLFFGPTLCDGTFAFMRLATPGMARSGPSAGD